MTARDNRMTARATPPPSAPEHPTADLRGMFGALQRLGYDLDALMMEAGIRRQDAENPDVSIPARACAALLDRAQRQRHFPNFPARLALETPVGANPLLDYLIVSSDCVGEGLKRLSRYIGLVNPAIVIVVFDQEDPARVVVERAADRFGIEFTVALSLTRFRSEAGDALEPCYVSLAHALEDEVDFARLMRCPVRTRRSWNGWALPQSMLQLPLRRRDPSLRGWLERKANEIQAQHPQTNQGVIGDVRGLLTSRMAEGSMRIEPVAQQLGMTPRTLQRKLADAGTSFDSLRDTIRRHAACAFLSDSLLSIGEIAYLLGYSEPAAFHRAFRRWHRMTPQEFRLQHQHA